jgi:hypothetical protein
MRYPLTVQSRNPHARCKIVGDGQPAKICRRQMMIPKQGAHSSEARPWQAKPLPRGGQAPVQKDEVLFHQDFQDSVDELCNLAQHEEASPYVEVGPVQVDRLWQRTAGHPQVRRLLIMDPVSASNTG